MKKILSLVLILFLIIAITACGNKEVEEKMLWDRIPMVMVEEQLYLDTGEKMPVEIDDSAIIGTITSEVDGSEIPTQNGQSNFGCVGAAYAYCDDGIVVMINNEWQFFRKETDKLSLEKVIELSKKGNELSWEDFEKYHSIDIGSGLYIRHYDIDKNYYLLIGGGSIDEKPMYIRLVKANNLDNYIDIRIDNIDDFISK
ncbi:lipoprotein [Geosporobacter ferrireducens]|uniref:Uncharacterized protein n=1 Tax=Geosporobacter ferrireducens TaxID=1424294 RepID=A0A1D8GDI9_9FIRM|nr:hypothetical protein [Geosporobacter ferrireducens]AOT68967.1 hypothetical protein Gferi_05000 [Geosporobacter ferrireducens]MTI54792.1 hypothetical protein [Geosporobacter ferrireducens]